MTSGVEWPVIVMVGVEVQRAPGRRRLRDVVPLFSRPTTSTWGVIFAERARCSVVLNWLNAGFVRCHRDRVEWTQRELRRVCAETNAQFAEAVHRRLMPDIDRLWIELECISAASFDSTTDAYRGTYA